MYEVRPITVLAMVALAVVAMVGGWYTEGYWQAIFIEVGFGICLFVVLELWYFGAIFWQIPVAVAFIGAWYVRHSYWQAVLIEVGATYLLYIIVLQINDYVPETLEDLAPRGPYRPEIEEINHPGMVRQVTLRGSALHQYEEYLRAERRKYKEWLNADINKRAYESLIAHLAPLAEEQKEKPVREIRRRRSQRPPLPPLRRGRASQDSP